MVDCDEVLREVELYLDGELPAEQVTHIEKHLGVCGGCLHRVEFRQELRALIARKCGNEVLPESLLIRVRRVIESEG